MFSLRSAAVLGRSDDTTPSTPEPYQIPPAPKLAATDDATTGAVDFVCS